MYISVKLLCDDVPLVENHIKFSFYIIFVVSMMKHVRAETLYARNSDGKMKELRENVFPNTLRKHNFPAQDERVEVVFLLQTNAFLNGFP